MRVIRRSADRGGGGTAWLDSRHTFSFADYYDRDNMGFRSLRVINEDWIAPSQGFGAHPHRDMEILSYPIEGALEHRDSEGNTSTLAMTGSMRSRKVRPISVRETCRVVRSKSRAPSRASRDFTCLLAPDGVMPSAAAA